MQRRQTFRQTAQPRCNASVDARVTVRIGALALGLVLLPLSARGAEPGDLDSTFDGDGVVISDFGAEEAAQAVALQADGKIVTAGLALDPSSDGAARFAVARYLRNGRLDRSFGGGLVITDFGEGVLGIANAVAVQPDGKIIAAGYAAEISGGALAPAADAAVRAPSGFALVRYLPDGSPDRDFGRNGVVITDHLNATGIYALALQPDGKIVVAGSAFGPSTGQSSVALARFLLNGKLDRSFGDRGVAVTYFADSLFGVATAMALQPDGRIVVAGTGVDRAIGETDFALARYDSNGALDRGFGTDGLVLTDAGGRNDGVAALALQTDGKIVATGRVYVFDYDCAVVRYNPDGTLDSSFDGDGRLTADFGADDHITSLVLQRDGKIVAAGRQDLAVGQRNLALARFHTNGAVDTSFAGDGHVSIALGSGGSGYAAGVVLQPDGKIVTAGEARNSQAAFDFALARFHGSTGGDNVVSDVK